MEKCFLLLVRKSKSCVCGGIRGCCLSKDRWFPTFGSVPRSISLTFRNKKKVKQPHYMSDWPFPFDLYPYVLGGDNQFINEGFLTLGRGDTIYNEHNSLDSKARAVASVMVQTPTDIHYIEWSDLTAIFKTYHVFREDFLARMVFSYQIGDHSKVCLFFIFGWSSFSGPGHLSALLTNTQPFVVFGVVPSGTCSASTFLPGCF